MKILTMTRNRADNCTCYYSEISPMKVGEIIAKLWTDTVDFEGAVWKTGNDGFLRFPEYRYCNLGEFKDSEGNNYAGNRTGEILEEGRSQPIFEAREFSRWLAIRWFYTVGNVANPNEENGWIFLVKKERKEQYQHVKIPKECLIDAEGNMSFMIEGEKIFFPALLSPWPRPLLELQKYGAVGMLNALLEPSDENPLTALLRSGPPYRNCAKQIANKLKEISSFITTAKILGID